jgi:hypothetical protein
MKCLLHSRDDLQRAAIGLYAPVRDRLSPGRARARLGETATFYSQAGMELEGWARQLWMLAPLVAGGGSGVDAADLAAGLDHGTDPAHPEFWGWPMDGDQRFVEMAAIAFALRLCPELVWQPLSPAARERVAIWLGTINRRHVHANNWLFFRVLVNEGLAHVGAPHDFEKSASDLDALEAMHHGDGWYRDGQNSLFDHYNGFAFHFYGLLYATWAAERDPQRAARFRARAVEFAQDFACWFDSNGAAIPYGRSLVYRFGMAAFWAAAAYAGLAVFTPGILRGLVMRHLRDWLEKPILDSAGLLTLGHAYPNLHVTEIYNSPGSPYWAAKSLLILALPESHPFWQSPEEPLPDLPAVKLQAAGRLLVTRGPSGHATLLNSGQNPHNEFGNFDAKYARFAYSSRFAFSVPLAATPLAANAPDSSLLVSPDGQHWFGRGQTSDHDSGPDWVASTWSPMPGVTIGTRLTACPEGHRRRHEIRNEIPLHVVEGGFAVPRGPEPLASLDLNPVPGLVRLSESGHATFGDGTCHSSIRDEPSPGSETRRAELLEPWPNSNLLHPVTVIPVLHATLAPGSHNLQCLIEAEGENRNASHVSTPHSATPVPR